VSEIYLGCYRFVSVNNGAVSFLCLLGYCRQRSQDPDDVEVAHLIQQRGNAYYLHSLVGLSLGFPCVASFGISGEPGQNKI
jgi:hypothetical protein